MILQSFTDSLSYCLFLPQIIILTQTQKVCWLCAHFRIKLYCALKVTLILIYTVVYGWGHMLIKKFDASMITSVKQNTVHTECTRH